LVSAYVDDQFRLEYRATSNWQISGWFDLSSDPTLDLAVDGDHSSVLVEPFETRQAGSWRVVQHGTNPAATLSDQTPARVVFDTTMDWAPSGSNLVVRAVYTVWANGRIGLDSTLTNTGAASQVLDAVEYNHHTVLRTVNWAYATLASGRAVAFMRTDGFQPLSNLLVVNHGAESSPHQDHSENVYWGVGTRTLAQSESFARQGAFAVYPGGLDLAALGDRAAEALAPELDILQGATAVGSGYDPGQAAYVVNATGASVDLRLTNARDRHAPAIVVESFPYDSWTVSLDGVELVSSSRLSGLHGHAHYDATADELAFVYLETIPIAAADGARTFEIRGQ
jgi:hypothetical protein